MVKSKTKTYNGKRYRLFMSGIPKGGAKNIQSNQKQKGHLARIEKIPLTPYYRVWMRKTKR